MRKVPAVAGLALWSAAAFSGTAHADAEAGSGFGPYALAASAPALQLRVSDPSLCFSAPAGVNGCEGVIPESAATLRSGPIGHGLAAVAWPGGIAAGAGSLLITLGGSGVPPEATLLNDPVRADAYTNVGQSTVRNDSVPGSTMTATALPAKVSGEGSVSSTTSTPGGTVGSAVSRSGVALTGVSSATATAHSEVKDVTVAGVIHLASVVSDAHAVTNGVTASAKGVTTASGITVAGIAVTVDDHGVTALGTNASPAAEQAAVNAALSGAGISMALGAPQGTPNGGAIDYTAQSLVVFWKNPTTFDETIVLGGAHVSVSAIPAYVAPKVDVPVVVVPEHVPPGAAPPPVTGTTFPTVPVVTISDAPVIPPEVVPFAPQAASLPTVGGLRTRTLLLVFGGAALLAAAFRRLPDEVLKRTAVECRYEEQP